MIKAFKNDYPVYDNSCLIFENSTIIGNVKLGSNVSVWPYATIRGDLSSITIGDNTNVQESSVIHCDFNMPTTIGKNVTIGHNAIVHACTIGDNCLIGMGAILLDGCVIEDGALIAAGCVVPPNKVVPANHLVVGNPMTIVKDLTIENQNKFIEHANNYVKLANEYKEEM